VGLLCLSRLIEDGFADFLGATSEDEGIHVNLTISVLLEKAMTLLNNHTILYAKTLSNETHGTN